MAKVSCVADPVYGSSVRTTGCRTFALRPGTDRDEACAGAARSQLAALPDAELRRFLADRDAAAIKLPLGEFSADLAVQAERRPVSSPARIGSQHRVMRPWPPQASRARSMPDGPARPAAKSCYQVRGFRWPDGLGQFRRALP